MWYFKNKEFTSEDINKAFGFVYIIIDKESGKSYIGQKHFWSKKTKQKDGKKRKVKCESDWQKYKSSNEYLKSKNEDELEKHILYLCVSKGQLNYVETMIQMDLRVLEHQEKWLNGIINIRCHHTHHKINQLIDKDKEFINKLYEEM